MAEIPIPMGLALPGQEGLSSELNIQARINFQVFKEMISDQ